MQKFFVSLLIILFIAPIMAILPVKAAYNDFTADSNITVTGVTGDGLTADFTIINGSTAESWSFNGGVFTVTVAAGSSFSITCSNTSVLGINYTMSGYTNCADNSVPGSSMVTLSGTGTFTVAPRSTNCSGGSGVTPPPSGGGGGGSTPTPIPTPTPTTETTPTPTTSAPTAETAPTTAPGEPAKDSQGNVTLGQMTADAETIASGDVNQVIAKMVVQRDSVAESTYSQSIVSKIVPANTSSNVKNAITNFVTYGTPATKILGAGERGGVVNSFQAAFGKLPGNQSDWNDVIKIANGRWPSQINEQAESKAKINFEKVYLREANISNAHDNAAITVMTYGLRPAQRNLNSEKAAIKSFKAIYGYNPVKATAWDVVRAIAYSGATR